MKVRKQISLDENILNKGLVRANELFGGNFSIYLAYLINQDAGDIKVEKKETKPKETKLDEEVKSELDDILKL